MAAVLLAVLAVGTFLAVAGWRLRAAGLHLVTAALCAGLGFTAMVLAVRDTTVLEPDAPLAAGVVLAGLLAIAGGSVVTSSVFALIDGRDSGESGSMRRAGEVLRGGAWIGGLERGAVFATIVAGWPEGIAITLALKGLGRYPELRTETPGAAERFIIGTFTSVLWAVACAGTAHLMT
ncbi:hypothetical protein [Nocardioides sp. Root151]|uniref:hypothetical protein n=1 Tax=Nocardioides sp. Root151 TaxID=1736475 RepID=UPI000703094F|nr:hypothetical protein [Nocardioides sp. Root151]KQZ69797.1 hypothetical protein ASD66_08775 [Nocardioides sp. Root151]